MKSGYACWLAAALLLHQGACTFNEQVPPEYRCSAERPQCPAGYTCSNTRCVKPGVDTRAPDLLRDGPLADRATADSRRDLPAADVSGKDVATDLAGKDVGKKPDALLPDARPPDQRPPDLVPPPDGPCSGDASRFCYTGPAGTSGVGLCKPGTQGCAGGNWGPCVGQVVPSAELCDGQDNNCSGATDETFGCVQNASASCTTTCGSTGTKTCSATCVWGSCVPPAEVCNGLDDDCVGGADNGLPCVKDASTSCTTTCGSTGTKTCSTSCTWGSCVPPAEVCNGLDDDCVGGADNGLPCVKGASTACATTCGSTGTKTCGATCDWGSCVPPAEVCNGLDDDCVGGADNGLPTATYYQDSDGDTYGNPAVSKVDCKQPANYVTNNTDCYDQSASAKPGQTQYFTSHRGDGSFDFNCNGSTEKRYNTKMQNCQPFSGYCQGLADAYCNASEPACGASVTVGACVTNYPTCSTSCTQTATQSCR